MAAVPGQVLVAGRIPGERIATTIATADSANFTAETVVMSVIAQVVAGRIYRVKALVRFASSVDNDDVVMRIREDTVSGAILNFAASEFSVDNQETWGESMVLEAEYTADATEDKTFVVTGQRDTGGTGNLRLEATTAGPSYFYVDYIRG